MRFAALSERLAVNPKRLREWVRLGVVQAMEPPSGRGRHNEYDDASLLVAAVAEVLDGLHITVAHYQEAFSQLHALLRKTSSLEWGQYQLDLTPISARLLDIGAELIATSASVRVDLSRLCMSLMISERQQSLSFGLRRI